MYRQKVSKAEVYIKYIQQKHEPALSVLPVCAQLKNVLDWIISAAAWPVDMQQMAVDF